MRRKESLPSRERGLKLDILPHFVALYCVAPLAGARIEIPVSTGVPPAALAVAPLAGARIEIIGKSFVSNIFNVAPLAGARIEIISHEVYVWVKTSLPSRERGLK